MKIRTIISRSAWIYKLHIGRDTAGHYYAGLRTRDGARVGTIVAQPRTASLDHLINHAERLYQDLAARITQPEIKTQPISP